jgi:hypothetical protein
MKKAKDATRELTLMLLYLNSFSERMSPGLRSWKGYDFGALNELEESGYIYGSHKAKSVMLDETGIEKAKALLVEYGIEEWS